MVIGVIELTIFACDDPACASITRTGREYSVFPVITSGLTRQSALAVLENGPVFSIGEGATLLDESKRLNRLSRKTQGLCLCGRIDRQFYCGLGCR